MQVKTYNDIKYYQSDLLNEHDFIHAFFTKRLERNEPKELQNGLNLSSNIHFLNQIHNDKIITINNTLYSKIKTGDCLITQKEGQSLWIYTADCIPMLIADTKTRNIAALHSGLKGLKKQIISKTLKKIIEIGSNKNNLIFALGPAIQGDKYEVKIKDVDDLIFQLAERSNEKKVQYLFEDTKEKLIYLYRKSHKNDTLLFDIQAAAILQLHNEGIKNSQIDLNRLCTFSNTKLFNSFRRDQTSFRQWSCIYS